MINMIAMLEVAHGIKPIKVIHRPDNSRPSGMNFFGLERSDHAAIKNLDKP